MSGNNPVAMPGATLQQGNNIKMTQLRRKSTSRINFGDQLKNGAVKAANLAGSLAGVVLPGSFAKGRTIVNSAIAMQQGAGSPASMTMNTSAHGNYAGGGANSMGLNAPMTASDNMAIGGTGGSTMTNASTAAGTGTDMIANMQAQGEYYMKMQINLQQENRQYTAMSNIMKIRHDTAKSAIQNVRA